VNRQQAVEYFTDIVDRWIGEFCVTAAEGDDEREQARTAFHTLGVEDHEMGYYSPEQPTDE
jgi:hypothetical protein